MRSVVIAILLLALAGGVSAADRATMPDNPNAYQQPVDWSVGLQGDDPIIEIGRFATVYTNLADFLDDISPIYYFDDFSWANWGVPNAPSYDFGPVNGYGYTATATNGIFGIPGAISTNSALDPIVITFTGAPITALAGDFYGTDFDGVPVPANTIVTLSDGTVVSLPYPTVFAGFTSGVPIASLTISTDSTASVWVTFDNFYCGEMGSVATQAATLSDVKALFR
ncbi:MAG TPA: hypothetical protein PLL30_12355 [Candidatus Krumholzibacteria bacterium]|nr:hypothetical protein [Candidatus Krumholzibacteria bacterium]HPD72560.1 hypothetical protein [Candidatus Krumholzibacteria bacterium]HRY40508.1 hypothetical protein [Candidatus Krumholzibacteria bacterium]